jgi:hypothetical protein
MRRVVTAAALAALLFGTALLLLLLTPPSGSLRLGKEQVNEFDWRVCDPGTSRGYAIERASMVPNAKSIELGSSFEVVLEGTLVEETPEATLQVQVTYLGMQVVAAAPCAASPPR